MNLIYLRSLTQIPINGHIGSQSEVSLEEEKALQQATSGMSNQTKR